MNFIQNPFNISLFFRSDPYQLNQSSQAKSKLKPFFKIVKLRLIKHSTGDFYQVGLGETVLYIIW